MKNSLIFCKKSIFAVGWNNIKKKLSDYFVVSLSHFCCWLPSRTFTAPWQPISFGTEIMIPLLLSISGCLGLPTEFICLSRSGVLDSCKNILSCPWAWLKGKVFSVEVFCPTLQLNRRTWEADTRIRNKSTSAFLNHFWVDLSVHEPRKSDHSNPLPLKSSLSHIQQSPDRSSSIFSLQSKVKEMTQSSWLRDQKEITRFSPRE